MSNKYEIFEYILSKLIFLEKELNRREKKEMSEEQIFNKFTNVRIMKLLFLIVILDKKRTLRGVFNNFVAYPKGPVEEDIYSDIKSKGGIKGYKDLLNNIDINDDTKVRIDHIFKNRKYLILSLLRHSELGLIEISHESLSWRKAWYDGRGRMDDYSENDNMVKEERKALFTDVVKSPLFAI